MEKFSWTSYYLKIAKTVSEKSTCLRRKYGAVLVKDNRIISTGYNGACVDEPNCLNEGVCIRQEKNIPHGERYELCKSVHAEMNVILYADPERMKNADLYIYGEDKDKKIVDAAPCFLCRRIISNANIRRVIYLTDKGITSYMLKDKKIRYSVHFCVFLNKVSQCEFFIGTDEKSLDFEAKKEAVKYLNAHEETFYYFLKDKISDYDNIISNKNNIVEIVPVDVKELSSEEYNNSEFLVL